jgi:hypothetical protein
MQGLLEPAEIDSLQQRLEQLQAFLKKNGELLKPEHWNKSTAQE